MRRAETSFVSDHDECAAWHYPGTNGACIVMAGGYGMTKEAGTDLFAARFQRAGFSVLAFDYRRLGASGGQPRQVIDLGGQRADWHAAIGHARTLPEVDAGRIAIWSFSMSGGHVFEVAADDASLAAAIAQTPNADGRAASRIAMRYTTRRALARLGGRALLDTIGGWFGCAPMLVPLTGPRGTVALLSTPDAVGGAPAVETTQWPHEVAARSVLSAGSYRPGRAAARVRCPLLVVVADDDLSAAPEAAVAAAGRAPRGELLRVPGGHYAPFLGAHDQVVDAEIAFLQRVVLDRATV